MPEIVRYIVRKLLHPGDTFRALRLRADMRWLMLSNRFAWSAVAAGNPGPVVSLTTYGKRVQAVYLAIESIARGSVLPSRLILWIDDAALYANLPGPLLRLKRRGLEIRYCKNYGPHKKYYPYVESQKAFNAPLVTADDDVIYPRSWLAGLRAAHQQFPGCVNCYRARVMTLRGGKIAPYREWPLCDSIRPAPTTVATGVSGVIYPSALLADLKSAGTAFEARCPKADDLWLHVQAIRSGFQIRQIQPEPIHFPMIPGSQESSLYAENCALDDGNDRQLAVTYEARDLELFESSAFAFHA
ncbi:MAG TPA: hypothetical protein VI320_11240 [Terracidiphilus sp.]|jgi:hypothetical protein